jgi:glycosidase
VSRKTSLPSWAGKVLYLAMIDRFANGDPSRDDFGRGEHSPADDDKFQGGDLEGLRRRLPFLKSLGVDSVWITPPVHNQWINPDTPVRGYHGYWAYDFTAVDPHFGTLEDYRRMVADAHALGMTVIQDIVVNHTGNFFTVASEGYDPKHPERSWRALPEAYPPDAEPKSPNDPVFRMNDARDPAHRKAAVYNFTPNITDYRDRRQTLTQAMGDLDDINLDSPLAARRMREIYRFWIEQAGVDGFRVDTVYYTPEAFYDDFVHRRDPADPGMKPFAAARGKPEFLVFGEVWSYDHRAIGRYLDGPKGPRLDSAVDLPLNEAINQVFFRKTATEHMTAALAARKSRPELWVTFADNHDTERVWARGTPRAARQPLAAHLFLPGLTCVSPGTEAGLTGARQNMHDAALCSPKRPEYRFLKSLIAARKARPALHSGAVRPGASSPSCGLLSWTVARGRERYRALFNTSASRVAAPLPAWKGARAVLASDRLDPAPVVVLAPESFALLDESRARRAPAPPAPRLRAPAKPVQRGPFELRYSLPRGAKPARLDLLCDGDYDRRVRVPRPELGRLLADPETLGGGRRRLSLLMTAKDGTLSLSNEVELTLRCGDKLLAERGVPAANKGGFAGRRVLPPAEKSYDGQLSMERARAFSRGRDLVLELLMDRVTNSWNPPEGYDHAYFSVHVALPGGGEASALPKLGAALPGFKWDAGFLLYGWGSRSYAAAGSDAGRYGPPLPGEVKQSADPARRTVTFVFSERCFGALKGWSGAKVLVSTWDGYLGELRGLSPKPEDWTFSVADGGPLEAPKIYDHILLEL